MIKQFVIDSTSKKVKRWGYCDFSADGSFDAATEQVIEKEVALSPSQNWYWNEGMQEFQNTPV